MINPDTISTPEWRIQVSIVSGIRLQYDCLVASRPNEGRGGDRHRAMLTAVRLKQMGLLAGMGDLDILWRRSRIGFLEIKNETGRLNNNQLARHRELQALGFPVAVVRSVSEAFAALDGWGVPTRAGVSCRTI